MQLINPPNSHDGAKIEPQWIPPVYSGPEPSIPTGPDGTDGGGGVEYHGSCRCGAVQAAVKLKCLLDETYTDPILECNCSICQRVRPSPLIPLLNLPSPPQPRFSNTMINQGGYIWIYPRKEQIALEGADNLAGYAFGNKVWKKMFCKTCGVHVMTDLNVQTDKEFAALPEDVRKSTKEKLPFRPVNVRIFNGFDALSLKTTKADGWDGLSPQYVNP